MAAVETKTSPSSTFVDRLAVLVALLAFVVGCYAVYSKLPREQVGLTVATLLGEPVVDPAHLHVRNVDFVTDFYGHRYKGSTRELIDSHVLYFGAWEKWILFFLRDSAAAVGGDSPVFVDVGANSGLHSLFMSSFAGTVHAIEPYPPALERIADAVERNGLTNLVIHAVGLGAEDATLPFFEPPNWNGGTGSFLQKMHESNDAKGLELQIVRGDDYFPAHGIDSIDLMKIDIEGYERLALEGMKKQLEMHRPLVVMELSVNPGSEELFSSMEQLRSAFPANYEFFTFATYSRYTGSYLLKPASLEFERETQYDLIVVPAEKAARMPKEADYAEDYRRLIEPAQ